MEKHPNLNNQLVEAIPENGYYIRGRRVSISTLQNFLHTSAVTEDLPPPK